MNVENKIKLIEIKVHRLRGTPNMILVRKAVRTSSRALAYVLRIEFSILKNKLVISPAAALFKIIRSTCKLKIGPSEIFATSTGTMSAKSPNRMPRR